MTSSDATVQQASSETATSVTTSEPPPRPVAPAVNVRPARHVTLRPFLYVTLIAAVSGLGLIAGSYTLIPAPARVEVDLRASAGSRLALYVNDLTRAPQTRTLVAGARKTYSFDGVVDDVALLRVDPTEAGSATVDIYSVAVVGRDGLLRKFEPASLAGWSMAGLVQDGVDGKALHVHTVMPYPYLFTTEPVLLNPAAPRWTKWWPRVAGPDFGWHLVAASVVLILVAALGDPARRAHLPIALGTSALVIAIVSTVPRLPDRQDKADVAVSRATFLGLSTDEPLIASLLLLLCATGVGVVASRLRRPTSPPDEPGAPPPKTRHVAAAWLTLAILTSPGIAGLAQALSVRQFVPHWDYDNMVYWSYLSHTGHLPYRDYWYAYGGLFVFDWPFPVGLGLHWLYDGLLFATLWTAVGRWRGAGAATFTTAVLFVAQRVNLVPGFERYVLALTVVVAYVALRRSGHAIPMKLLLWTASATALFIEPVQLLYAGVPVALILAADAFERWREGPGGRAWVARRMAADFGVPAAVAAAYGVLLAVNGQLGGFLAYYGRLDDSVAYSAWPTGLPVDVRSFSPELALLITAAILIAIGVYERLQGGERRWYGDALAGLGLVLLTMMQKHFIRWMPEHLFLLLLAGALFLALGWPRARTTLEYTVAGALVGAFAAMLALKPHTWVVLASAVEAPKRAVSDVSILARGDPSLAAANAAEFSPERFSLFAPEREVIDRLRAHAGPTGDIRLFALTDDPVLYLLTGQAPVWQANLYNASPVYEQARVVRWLRQKRPPYVVVDPDRLRLDGFQKVVRVPLVFAEVVERYVPLESTSRLDILRRRGFAESIAWSYWRTRLGSDVDLGRLATVSSFDPATSCGTTCADLLEVEVPPGGSTPLSITVRIADQPFSVTFSRVPARTEYRVLLDRVWFWRAAKESGVARTLVTGPECGCRVEIARALEREGVLY